jgi:amidase
MGALTSASATSLARLIARRDVTAREAVEARLRRIEAVDGEVNAVVQLDAERAYGGGIETDNPVHGRTSNPDEALGAAGATMQDARHPDGGHELTIEVWRSDGEGVAAAELWRLLRRWDDFRSRMLAFAARFDVLLCPVFPSPARLHGTMNVAGELDPTSWTTPPSLTGWPAATVRAGTSAEGLPVDVQLVARPRRDDVALATALRVERELGAWAPPRGVRRDRPRPARRGTG